MAHNSKRLEQGDRYLCLRSVCQSESRDWVCTTDPRTMKGVRSAAQSKIACSY